jgi:hypothetical protein
MTSTTQWTPEQLVERNLQVVDEHFHNENPADIDKAIALYAPEGPPAGSVIGHSGHRKYFGLGNGPADLGTCGPPVVDAVA